jgi:hypothetical protein
VAGLVSTSSLALDSNRYEVKHDVRWQSCHIPNPYPVFTV